MHAFVLMICLWLHVYQLCSGTSNSRARSRMSESSSPMVSPGTLHSDSRLRCILDMGDKRLASALSRELSTYCYNIEMFYITNFSFKKHSSYRISAKQDDFFGEK